MTDPNRAARVGKNAPWPKGKPRNDPDPWLAIRTEVQQILVEPDYEGCSRGEIARLCGVNRTTAGKWVAGLHTPKSEHVETITGWLKDMVSRNTNIKAQPTKAEPPAAS